VARADANQYAISARGFSGVLANKMLVMIDGRTVYSPLFSGVFWEARDDMLEDVERIEVLGGPQTTLWGTNAVNGVINVITKPAQATQGGLLAQPPGRGESLPAPGEPALAERAVSVDDRVADLAPGAPRSAMQGAVEDEPGADAFPDVERAVRRLPSARAEQHVSERLGARLQVHEGRHAETLCDQRSHGESVESGCVVRTHDLARLRVDHPGDGDADAA
jgi:hypothetical protein